ncbi:hypothetical protein E3N88_30472 [Mikania micrantha]|uniref:Uncharacterized protein n=1 Tax=Mikania micrantha TaxID=192012 RepID=A0A5N6MM96_9ASTR|nr:hypothetical protein E3N88_30472 [Mikania micrantha]
MGSDDYDDAVESAVALTINLVTRGAQEEAGEDDDGPRFRRRVVVVRRQQPEIETVPETQHQDVESGPSQRKRAHRRKAPEEPREKPTQIPWSSEEQMALAREKYGFN